MDYKKLATILSLLFIMGTVNAIAPDINITSPSGESLFSHRNTTLTIDFNIFDPDTNANGVLLDLNFSTSTTQGTGTGIIIDLNLSNASCSSDNFATTAQCSHTFNTGIVTSSGTFFILALADDQNATVNTNFDANGSFVFTKLSKEDALCASISSDLFVANGCVDEDGFEDATSSSLAIGTLEFGDASGLLIFLLIVTMLVVVFTAAILKFTKLGEMIFGKKN